MNTMTTTNTTDDPLNESRPLEAENWYDAQGNLRGSEQPVPGCCGRQLRGTKPPRYCEKRINDGKACCRHGGKSLSGPAHPNYKPINHIPMDLATVRGEKIAKILESPNLFSLSPQYAYLMSRINDLLADERTGRHGSLWDDMQEQITDIRQRMANPEQPTPPTDAELGAIAELATNGRANERIHRDIRALIQECAKVAGIEARRQADAGEVATKAEMAALGTVISSALNQYVKPLPGGMDTIKQIAAYISAHMQKGQRPVAPPQPHQG